MSGCNFLTCFKVDFLGVRKSERLSVLVDKRFSGFMCIYKCIFLRDLKFLDTLQIHLYDVFRDLVFRDFEESICNR
jgi:hypothetical protein